MGHRDADPMSNLLSSVGGIDASLFRKPPALKDIAKTTTTVKASPVAPPKPAVSSTARPAEVQASAQAAPVFAARVPVPSAQKPEGAQRAGSNPGSKLDPFSSSQLDVFAGLGPAPRQSRAMRSQLPGQSPGVSSASSSVSEGLDLLARSDAPAGATPPGKPVDVHMQDSLDALFGSQPAGKPQQVSQPAPAPAYGGHDLFGGLVSGAAPYAASSPAKSQPSSTLADDDFMEGFSQKSSAALPDDDFMGAFNGSSGNPAAPAADPFDVFAAPAPHTPQPQQPSVSHASDDLLGGFDGSLGMVDHMPTPAPPTQPATMRTPAPATSTEAVTSQQARQVRRSRSEHGGNFVPTVSIPIKRSPSGHSLPSPTQNTPSPTTRPQLDRRISGKSAAAALRSDDGAPSSAPPAYDAVTRGAASASSHSSLSEQVPRYNVFDKENAVRADPASAQPSSQRQRLDEGYSGREESVWENPVQEGGEAHHAKWLTSGSKWLKSAGKKLTQAAQVGAATLQSKLEEMDHRFAQKGHGHGRSRVGSDGEELDEIPAFYYEWAAKIQELPHERQSSTLGQMTEDDRLVVQRILDQAAVNRAKPPQRGARSYDSYGQSNESPPAPRPITRQSRTLSTEHDFDEHSDTEVRRQPSDGLQQGDGDASPAHAARQPSESGRRSGLSQGTAFASAHPAVEPQQPQSSPHHPASPPPNTGRTSAATAPSTAAHVDSHADLLGFSGQPAAPPPAAPQPTAAPQGAAPPVDADFLGFSGSPTRPAAAPASQPAASSTDVDFFGFSGSPVQATASRPTSAAQHIDDMFNAKPPSPPKAAAAPAQHDAHAQPAAVPRPAAAAARPAGIPSRPAGPIKSASLKAAAAEMMIDFGEEGMAAAMAAMSTVSDVDVAGEPEARKEARARRLAEMRERMQAQLAEKQARDEEEAALSAAKGDLRDQYQARMDAWLSGKKDNIRALLSTLHTVLWEGSGWVQPGLTDLVEPARVKKAYMKANLIIHPDKVKQKGGTVEQLVVADMAFDALKTAWGRFEAELKRG